MNQYQRMVSYLYEYKRGIKGVNVGYVRIEQRGSGCRISLQMRSRNLGQLWDVAVFRQGISGIRYYSIGTLTERNGDYRCRIETDSANLMESGIDISEVDGIILYQDDTYYIATTWKNQGIRLGERKVWDPSDPDDFDDPAAAGQEEIDADSIAEDDLRNGGQKAEQQSLEEDAGQMPLVSQEQAEDSVRLDEGLHTGRQKIFGNNADTAGQPAEADVSKTGQNHRSVPEMSDSGQHPEEKARMPEMSASRPHPEEKARMLAMGQQPLQQEERTESIQRTAGGEKGQNPTKQMAEQGSASESVLQQAGQEPVQNSGQNEVQSTEQQPQRQNGMQAMGPKFPRWGGMPFFRRRPMGSGNVSMPIQMTGEWGNGNRQAVETGAENPTHAKTGEHAGADAQETASSSEYREQMEEQAVCRNCPFKRKNIDYGKRILMTFPVMRPFPNDQKHACVRIEPQDLGCLPMQMWTLANNHFLLQGYYCYRHLIFMETENHGYALGVPGIYGRRESHQAEQFGFSQFRAICGGTHCEGAFGYWMMPLSCG